MDNTVKKWGNSLGVRLPKHIAAEAGLKNGSNVNIKMSECGAITITPTRPKYKLSDLLKGHVKSDHVHAESDWGGQQGEETI